MSTQELEFLSMFPRARGHYEVVARQMVWEEENNPVLLSLTFQEKNEHKDKRSLVVLTCDRCSFTSQFHKE